MRSDKFSLRELIRSLSSRISSFEILLFLLHGYIVLYHTTPYLRSLQLSEIIKNFIIIAAS